MLKASCFLAALLLLPISSALGQDYRVEAIDGAPDADEVPSELVEQFAEQGVRVIKGTSRTVCEIWLCKSLELDPEFESSEARLYPFSPGQLVGLLHFSRRGSDFRDQTVSSGWYTLRFDLQPVDGNHEGTSVTRDFLLLVEAGVDELDKIWGVEELHEVSAEAAGSSHPAMLCLGKPTDGKEAKLIHDESTDWWSLHLVGKGKAGDKAADVPIDLIVVGYAEE